MVTGTDEFPNLQWVEKLVFAIRNNKDVSGDFVGQ